MRHNLPYGFYKPVTTIQDIYQNRGFSISQLLTPIGRLNDHWLRNQLPQRLRPFYVNRSLFVKPLSSRDVGQESTIKRTFSAMGIYLSYTATLITRFRRRLEDHLLPVFASLGPLVKKLSPALAAVSIFILGVVAALNIPPSSKSTGENGVTRIASTSVAAPPRSSRPVAQSTHSGANSSPSPNSAPYGGSNITTASSYGGNMTTSSCGSSNNGSTTPTSPSSSSTSSQPSGGSSGNTSSGTTSSSPTSNLINQTTGTVSNVTTTVTGLVN